MAFSSGGGAVDRDGVPDLYNLLYVMTNYGVWRDAFSQGPLAESRYLVEELHQVRNRDAHIHTYGNAITYRDLDTITRVLDLIGASEAARVGILRQDALRDLCQELREKMADKKRAVLAFLTESVFAPVLASPGTPEDVRRRVEATMETVSAMDTAREIVAFYGTPS